MRTKKPLLIALFLCTWSIVSYIFLIRQTVSSVTGPLHNNLNSNDQQKSLLQKLNQLEESIRAENDLHDVLVQKLLEAKKLIDIGSLEDISKKINVGHVKRLDGDGIDNKENAANSFDDNSNRNINDVPLEETNHRMEDDQNALMGHLKSMTKENLENAPFKGPVIPVLVFACNRISVRNCLDNLVQYRPNVNQFPIIVSQVSK